MAAENAVGTVATQTAGYFRIAVEASFRQGYGAIN
jgi:hypothetical protein